MTNSLTTTIDGSTIESVVIGGDLSKLTPSQRVAYYKAVCESIGLNPLTRPFDYITLNGRLTLYALKGATDQLRKNNDVSIDDVDLKETDTQFIVKVKGHDKTGRTDVELGVVNKSDMRGDLANAQMKAITKAKRRFTLSICGLGMLDETEIETIPNAHPVIVEETGEIVQAQVVEPKSEKPIKVAPASNGNSRPGTPEQVRTWIETKAQKVGHEFVVSDKQLNLLRYGLEMCFVGEENVEDKRHTVLQYLTGNPSTKAITGPKFKAILEGWLDMKQDSGGEYHVNPYAIQEAHAIYTEALQAEGQLSF